MVYVQCTLYIAHGVCIITIIICIISGYSKYDTMYCVLGRGISIHAVHCNGTVSFWSVLPGTTLRHCIQAPTGDVA